MEAGGVSNKQFFGSVLLFDWGGWRQKRLFDINAKYNFKIGKLDATVYGNINNLFNTEYIADATDGTLHDETTSIVWYGFGRTWTTGLKIKF